MLHRAVSGGTAKYDAPCTATRNDNAVRSGLSLPTTKVTRQCMCSSLSQHYTHVARFSFITFLPHPVFPRKQCQTSDTSLSLVITISHTLMLSVNASLQIYVLKVPNSNNVQVFGCQLRLHRFFKQDRPCGAFA